MAFAHLLIGKPHGRQRSAAKVINVTGEKISGYDVGFQIRMRHVDMPSPEAALRTLEQITSTPNVWVQLGDLTDGARGTVTCFKGESWTAPMPRLSEGSPRLKEYGLPFGLNRICDTRWLVFDIDGIDIPGFNAIDPEPGIEHALHQTGHTDTSYLWQLTSSQQLDTESARLRVWMLTDQLHAPGDLKNYLKCMPIGLKIDPCVYDQNRAIYTSPPKIMDGEDFIPKRSGIIWKSKHTACIEIPDADAVSVVRRVRREAGAGVGGMDMQYLATGDECRLVVDGDLHGGMGVATWWLAERDYSLKESRELIIDHIRQSDMVRKEEAIARVQSNEYERLFNGAKEIHDSQNQQIEGIAPEFPINEIPLSEAEEKLSSTMEKFYRDGGQCLLSGAAGLGKTEEAIGNLPCEPKYHDALIELFSFAPHVDIYVPSHALGEEMVNRIHFSGKRAVLIQGRTRPGIDGEPLCQRHELVQTMRDYGVSGEGSTLCVRNKWGDLEFCPHYAGCPYVEQFKGIDNRVQVVIRTHEALTQEPSLAESLNIGEPMVGQKRTAAFTVIDESPLHAMIEEGVIDETMVRRNDEPIFSDIMNALHAGHNLVEKFSDRASELHDAIDAFNADRPYASPRWSDSKIRFQIMKYARPRTPIAAFEALHYAIKRGEKQFNGIWKSNDYKLRYSILKPVTAARPLKNVMVMDGTLDDVMFRYVFPKAELVTINAPRVANVHQVYDRSYSHAQIRNEETVTGIARFIRMHEAQGKTVGLIAPMEIEEAINHEYSAHYQALRGVDRLKGVDTLVQVGRTLPPAEACEVDARALFPYEEMDLTGEYIRRPAGYRMRDGSRSGVSEWYHPDPLVNRVLRQKREAESTQGIDRARLIHRDTPADVFVLSRLPLDLTVDTLIRDPLSVPRVLEALDSCEWVLPLVPDWLVERLPKMFSTVTAAKRWSARTRDAWKQTPCEPHVCSHRETIPAPIAGKQHVCCHRETVPALNDCESKVTGTIPLLESYRETVPVDCTSAVVPGGQMWRFRLANRHKRQADKNLPVVITTLSDRDEVERILGEHFPDDDVSVC